MLQRGDTLTKATQGRKGLFQPRSSGLQGYSPSRLGSLGSWLHHIHNQEAESHERPLLLSSLCITKPRIPTREWSCHNYNGSFHIDKSQTHPSLTYLEAERHDCLRGDFRPRQTDNNNHRAPFPPYPLNPYRSPQAKLSADRQPTQCDGGPSGPSVDWASLYRRHSEVQGADKLLWLTAGPRAQHLVP